MSVRSECVGLLSEIEDFRVELRDCLRSLDEYRERVFDVMHGRVGAEAPGETLNEVRAFLARSEESN